jgi:hypothetical protein
MRDNMNSLYWCENIIDGAGTLRDRDEPQGDLPKQQYEHRLEITRRNSWKMLAVGSALFSLLLFKVAILYMPDIPLPI